jgi:hypothetical protein
MNTVQDLESNPVLTVSDFPWVTDPDPLNPKTIEEYAYASGLRIARIRAMLEDDSLDMIINEGAGPGKRRRALDNESREENEVGHLGIFTAIEPADLELYRRLLPANFEMPEKPVLSLANLNYNQPNPIVRFKEGLVMLKGVCADGEESWYVHAMPVEQWLVLVKGHDWGFRKDFYDMTVTREKTSVLQKNGDLYMSLELTDHLDSDEDLLISQESAGGHNNMAVIYPKNPEMVLRFGWTGKAVPFDDDKRMVKISVNPVVDWAGLVGGNTIAPGFFMRYAVDGGDTYIKKLRST